MEQGGKSREASPIYLRGLGGYDEDLRGDSVLKASVNGLQLPKMG
jgi:hypothetical protein